MRFPTQSMRYTEQSTEDELRIPKGRKSFREAVRETPDVRLGGFKFVSQVHCGLSGDYMARAGSKEIMSPAQMQTLYHPRQ